MAVAYSWNGEEFSLRAFRWESGDVTLTAEHHRHCSGTVDEIEVTLPANDVPPLLWLLQGWGWKA